MTGIVIPDGGTIGSASDTDAITIASDGNVTVNQSIKATAIKHTNGTTAITINSDGSLSGKFEGAVKFVSIGKATGNPTNTNKVWIVFGITSSYNNSSISGKQMAAGFGQPVGILTYNTGTSSWNSWHYVNQTTTGGVGGQLSDSSSTPTGNFYEQQGFTYTVEMDKV